MKTILVFTTLFVSLWVSGLTAFASPCNIIAQSENAIGYCVPVYNIETHWYKVYHVFTLFGEDASVFQSGSTFNYRGEFNVWECICFEPQSGGDRSCEMFAFHSEHLAPGIATVWQDGICIIPDMLEHSNEPDPDPLQWECNDGIVHDCEGGTDV